MELSLNLRNPSDFTYSVMEVDDANLFLSFLLLRRPVHTSLPMVLFRSAKRYWVLTNFRNGRLLHNDPSVV